MTEVTVTSSIKRLHAVYTLIRILPVLSWGITSSLVGLGFAHTVVRRIHWLDYGLILLLIVLIHGVLSHAVNDQADWLSGTDQLSPGILSGGSHVIPRSLYTLEQLSFISKTALLLSCIITIYFVRQSGPIILVLLALALWSAIAYSCPPFRLAYHPLAGEWLCGFPAVAGCAVGTFYVLTHTLNGTVFIAGAIHGLFAIGLLMHHHISDITGDLASSPRKLTTVALAELTLGNTKTPLVAIAYFLLAFITGIAGALYFHPVFWVTVPAALGCIGTALFTDPKNIQNITASEYLIYAFIICDAVAKTVLLFRWQG